MKPHLFLTGEIGAGKSTAIAQALGDHLPKIGGFRTCRSLDAAGKPAFFTLETPDGAQKQVFLDFSTGKPQVNLQAFETLGTAALQGSVLMLDEIGGVELMSSVFWKELERVLQSDVPILGVVKGRNPSDALAKALGLSDAYHRQSEKLWKILTEEENTLIYHCEKYDEKAKALAMQWVREYCLWE